MLKRLLNWFRKPNQTEEEMENLVETVLHKLVKTDEEEISCDEVHELIDQFTELEVAGEDVQHLMPLVQKHLELCGDCREEHDVLEEILQQEEQFKGD